MCDFYCPHPKDEGRYCFQFVSSHLDRRGGTPIPGQDGGGYPHLRSRRWGYPIPGQQGGVPSRSGGRGATTIWNNISCTSYAGAVCLLRSRRRTFLFQNENSTDSSSSRKRPHSPTDNGTPPKRCKDLDVSITCCYFAHYILGRVTEPFNFYGY